MGCPSNYFWVRIYDYVFERDRNEKGTMLDEFYMRDVPGGREEAKQKVKDQYCANAAAELKFAKPKKQTNGIYVIIMDSTKYFYDRFYATISTHCFWCTKPISGKACEFPHEYIGAGEWYDSEYDQFSVNDKVAHFCTYNCKAHFNNCFKNNEGEWQNKEEGKSGDVFGYIYLIYNRSEDAYYVGQTRFMPFFRWQEHVKDGGKGDISDLSFSVLAEVNRNKQQNEEQNQIYLNNIEAWWIAKYEQEQHKVFNISKPKITLQYLKDRFTEMVQKEPLLIFE